VLGTASDEESFKRGSGFSKRMKYEDREETATNTTINPLLDRGGRGGGGRALVKWSTSWRPTRPKDWS